MFKGTVNKGLASGMPGSDLGGTAPGLGNYELANRPWISVNRPIERFARNKRLKLLGFEASHNTGFCLWEPSTARVGDRTAGTLPYVG